LEGARRTIGRQTILPDSDISSGHPVEKTRLIAVGSGGSGVGPPGPWSVASAGEGHAESTTKHDRAEHNQ
jgi:hypothetical protein